MILFGDCRESLKRLSRDGISVQMCVTSPPYFGLRDYGHDGQMGRESTPEEYISSMVDVFRHVKHILKEDGVLWLNIGDSYSTSNNGTRKAKDLIGIPWMLAFALRDDGWYLRQDIIWNKPNPMPESVTDRCAKAHEYIFMLSKSNKYFFDHEAIMEPVAESTIARLQQKTLPQQAGSNRVPGKTNGNMKAVGRTDKRNRRSVWTVNTKPYKGAHFATFPPALIEPCILAGSRENDVVLDPFIGSGTTAEVCIIHNRNYIGCELNPDYKGLIDARINNAFSTRGNK